MQAKGGADQLSVVQAKQDIACCAETFPHLICRSISAQFMDDERIAIFELAVQDDQVKIVQERHYKLGSGKVPLDEMAVNRRSVSRPKPPRRPTQKLRSSPSSPGHPARDHERSAAAGAHSAAQCRACSRLLFFGSADGDAPKLSDLQSVIRSAACTDMLLRSENRITGANSAWRAVARDRRAKRRPYVGKRRRLGRIGWVGSRRSGDLSGASASSAGAEQGSPTEWR